MPLALAAAPDVSRIFIELGAAIVGLAVLGRLASRWGFSAIPHYLLAGLAFGNGVTALTKLGTGWWAARRAGIDPPGRWRAGATLVARGEFSIVIAGLGVSAGLEPRLGPLSAAYVLLMAIVGPILARLVAPRV
jgi:CPA2 family monovalent cation:H+ antiporter-2